MRLCVGWSCPERFIISILLLCIVVRVCVLQELLLSSFPYALSEDEVLGKHNYGEAHNGIPSQSGWCFDLRNPRHAGCVWHQLSEEEQRCVLFQFQRLSSFQFPIQFDPTTHELIVDQVTIQYRYAVCVLIPISLKKHFAQWPRGLLS